tara:strand:+ start:968 stop:1282 length:315 start_codon:yes stop_codon:yes gene_type:complete
MSNPYRYMMKIKYNEEAKTFIEALKKLGKTEGFKVRVRGSGPRAKHSLQDSNGSTSRMYDNSLPLKYATHVRLYLDAPKSDGEEYVGSGWIGQDWRTQLKEDAC